MNAWGRVQKRTFDILLALLGLFLTGWIILVAFLIASIETKSLGLFIQKRVGRDGKLFNVFKIKTMRAIEGIEHTYTTSLDPRITKSGKFFRETKIDELPQFFNVLFGNMSFVGPRPDVEGYADKLEGEDRVILTVRPGITGPASIKYRKEEELLAQQKNPQAYNDEIIWRDKVHINKEYVKNWTFQKDIFYIIQTVTGKNLIGA
jgi:lipopolysaccharide/colanic/teichoic acid biosynthesis glycosyltransferase